jgi:hypothetical protein
MLVVFLSETLIYGKEFVAMTQKSIALAIMMIVFFLPVSGFAEGVMEKDFEAQTAKQFVRLCSASSDDPLYHQAINFCRGFFEGAYQYYEALTSGPKGLRFVCVPNPKPSRDEAIARFVEWAKSNSQYMNEWPVEAEFRFLKETWPCK